MEHQARRRVGRGLGVVPVLSLLAADVQRASDVAEERLSMVVIGLVVLAVLIAVVTVLFWRATRPEPSGDGVGAMHWTPPAASTATPAAAPVGAPARAAPGPRTPAPFAPDRRAAEPTEPAR